jgi:ubiquinone/menaquinone biosynthesis C-methylase UbiE
MSNHQQLALVLAPTARTVNWRGFAEYFDLCAENNPSFQELRSSLLEQLGGLVLPPGPILDVGAGTGNFSIPLARMFPDRQIIHLDPEPGMNERAREKARQAGITNLSVREHDCHALELEPGSVAAIVTVHALYACPDPHAVIARVRPWLHPDGYLVACDLGRRHSSWDWGWYFFRHYWRRHGLVPALRFMARIRGFKQHTDQIGKSQRSGKYWTHTLEQFVQAFDEAGFSVVERRRVYRGYSNLALCQARPR